MFKRYNPGCPCCGEGTTSGEATCCAAVKIIPNGYPYDIECINVLITLTGPDVAYSFCGHYAEFSRKAGCWTLKKGETYHVTYEVTNRCDSSSSSEEPGVGYMTRDCSFSSGEFDITIDERTFANYCPIEIEICCPLVAVRVLGSCLGYGGDYSYLDPFDPAATYAAVEGATVEWGGATGTTDADGIAYLYPETCDPDFLVITPPPPWKEHRSFGQPFVSVCGNPLPIHSDPKIIHLQPDDDHVCSDCCAHPFPKSLTLMVSGAGSTTGTAYWNGSTHIWIGCIEFNRDTYAWEAVTTPLGPRTCCVQRPRTAHLWVEFNPCGQSRVYHAVCSAPFNFATICASVGYPNADADIAGAPYPYGTPPCRASGTWPEGTTYPYHWWGLADPASDCPTDGVVNVEVSLTHACPYDPSPWCHTSTIDPSTIGMSTLTAIG
jgi:hypothetical protein